MPYTREEVYRAIDSERVYQDARWGRRGGESSTDESIAAFIIYIEEYTNRAKAALTNNPEPQAQLEALEVVRKIAALGVACMEVHGARGRRHDLERP